jgi:2-iminoacetate synthase
VERVLTFSYEMKGLPPEDAAILLRVDDPVMRLALLDAARRIKERTYGRRVVLFAPLYISNRCVNSCLYCGFSLNNRSIERKSLCEEEAAAEVGELLKCGHKRILLVMGEEEEESSADYAAGMMRAIYSVQAPWGIRRINVNMAPLGVSGFMKLKEAGIGTYQLFQETYHRATYARMHPAGPKADYEKRLAVFESALKAGIDDYGMGALFGLYDFRFEVLGLLAHARSLEDRFGVGPHTVSVPRMQRATGAALSEPPSPVSDEDFMKIIAVLRLALPYTGLILSTRERPEMRNALLRTGISQISAGSSVSVGGYAGDVKSRGQFEICDERSLDETVKSICREGYLPSFCTACYRKGRTGREFMALAHDGMIHRFCDPNAIITFREYLIDYASNDTRKIGEAVIMERCEALGRKKGAEVRAKLAQVDSGVRDIPL